jgi:hypothetical protein
LSTGWSHPVDKKSLQIQKLEHVLGAQIERIRAEYALEHFPAKRIPVRVEKMRQYKNVELLSDSLGSESALAGSLLRAELCTLVEEPAAREASDLVPAAAGGSDAMRWRLSVRPRAA